MRWQSGRTTYEIKVVNPNHRCRGVESAELDGHPADANAIPLVDDGKVHKIVIELGDRLPVAPSTFAVARESSRR
jgi:hypothetical protein